MKGAVPANRQAAAADELKEAGLDPLPSRKATPHRISDALGWIEAVLEKEVTGDACALIIVRVSCAELNDRYKMVPGLRSSVTA
jgi:flavin reductase (DIM6/NTAB) family NADH-FMN oxidoreductase RutF